MLDQYKNWFEHECDSNDKMLTMLESVPSENRQDERYQQGLALAAHITACRENWLDRMTAGGEDQTDWWPKDELDTARIRARFAAMESAWRSCLSGLNEDSLVTDFEFNPGEQRYRWNIEGQIVQLVGHAFYHRGQIALLVQQLGGAPVDTDYLYWAIRQNPNYGKISG